LKVISRTFDRKIQEQAEESENRFRQQLGVANVLEGSVQKAADKVRVNVAAHRCARRFASLPNLRPATSRMSLPWKRSGQEIADSLQAKLSPAEASTLATAPTKDTAAYDLF